MQPAITTNASLVAQFSLPYFIASYNAKREDGIEFEKLASARLYEYILTELQVHVE